MSEDSSFEALLQESETQSRTRGGSLPRVGARVRGRILAIDGTQALVDIGAKSEATIDLANLTAAAGSSQVAVGDTIEATVASVDRASGAAVLGGQHGRALHGVAELERAFAQGTPVEGHISAVVKGGVEVRIAGQRAFCPAAQLDLRFSEDLTAWVGQRHAFRIFKLDLGRHVNLVVSRRALLEEEQAARAAATRAQLAPGAVFTGRVTALKEFGAFVDLGGVEGMVHISELTHGRVRHPEELLSVGQEIEVTVLRVEPSDHPKRPEKIALSIRALSKDPWSDAANVYAPGTHATGTVTRLQAFGAFVELAPGLEGLLHVSELGGAGRVAHPQDVLTPGQQVAVRVIDLDPARHRIALTLLSAAEAEAAAPAPAPRADARPADTARVGTLGALLQAQLNRRPDTR